MGVVNVREGYAEFRGYMTWFRVTGDLKAKKPPVVILHGGPGASHDYTDAFKLLALAGRAVIQYDQLGCGRSTHLRQKPKDFWTVQLFVDELDNLVKHARHRRRLPRCRPVLGRHARRRARDHAGRRACAPWSSRTRRPRWNCG